MVQGKDVDNAFHYSTSAEGASTIQIDDSKLPLTRAKKILTISTTNPYIVTFKAMEYAARGPVILRAIEIEKELSQGLPKPFSEVIKANLGDAHAMGQKPISFVRQVLALVTCPELINGSTFKEDVKRKATQILNECRGGSAGAYSDSRGLEVIRKHAAKYIQSRDGGVPCSPDDIILCAGASEGIRACLKLFKDGGQGKKSGVLIPVPQYPLYSASLGEYDIQKIDYYLDELKGWALDIPELERVIQENDRKCNPRAMVVINPGNPTGHVLSRKNMEEIIKFAYKEQLFIMADEVYQDNVYQDHQFFSFKRVMAEMGAPYDSMELVSFFSCSKGFVCECGLRGGFVEVVNMDPEVKEILLASIAAKLCPTVLGQAAVDCIVDPPQPGEPSYELFMQEKTSILKNYAERAEIVTKGFNSIPCVTCAPVLGAMYAFPQIILPEKAIEAARQKEMEPDVFYALELLELTGICVVPGSGIGQYPGTYHFRTTILSTTEKMKIMLEKFEEFHLQFLQKYSS